MRTFATTFLLTLLLVAPAALAQDPVPDTTEAWRYLPLHVGNIWEYEQWADQNCVPVFPPICESVMVGFLRHEVVRDSVVNDTTYRVLEETRFSTEGVASSPRLFPVRFDTTDARAFSLVNGEERPWPDWIDCPLDLPFESRTPCDEFKSSVAQVYGYDRLTLGIEGTEKLFVLEPGYDSYSFKADLGLVGLSHGKFVSSGQNIIYARVDGEEYGARFPVSSEPLPSQEDPFGLAAYPNPLHSAGTLAVTLDTPQHLRVDVFDLLGRRVRSVFHGDLAAGRHILPMDSDKLGAGLYVVRATTALSDRTVKLTVLD